MSQQTIGSKRSSGSIDMDMEITRRTPTAINLVILRHLSSHPGCSKTDLAMCASLNGLQASRYVGFLEATEVVVREGSKYVITDKGRDAMDYLDKYYTLLGITVGSPGGASKVTVALPPDYSNWRHPRKLVPAASPRSAPDTRNPK